MSIDPSTGAIYERTETLFYHAGLDAYLATGQALHEGGRRAYVAVKSAHTLNADQNAKLRGMAKDFASGSHMSVKVDCHRQQVSIYDEVTKTSTPVDLSEFSPVVRAQYPYRKPANYFDRLGL